MQYIDVRTFLPPPLATNHCMAFGSYMMPVPVPQVPPHVVAPPYWYDQYGNQCQWHDKRRRSQSPKRRPKQKNSKKTTRPEGDGAHSENEAPQLGDGVNDAEEKFAQLGASLVYKLEGADILARFRSSDASWSDAEFLTEEKKEALAKFVRKWAVAEFVEAAFESSAQSRAAQHALGKANDDEGAIFAGGFQNRVLEACKDLYANHVIQMIVEKLRPGDIKALVLEANGGGVELAKHKFGCRFLCRLLEHEFPKILLQDGCQQATLFDEVTREAGELCRHTYGNYVMEHILEHGLPQQRKAVAAALCTDTYEHAKNRNGSRIVEKALEENCLPQADRDKLCDALVEEDAQLQALAKHRFGCYVVKRVLELPIENSGPVASILREVPDPKFNIVVVKALEECQV